MRTDTEFYAIQVGMAGVSVTPESAAEGALCSTSFFSRLRKTGAILSLSSAAIAPPACRCRAVAFLSWPVVIGSS